MGDVQNISRRGVLKAGAGVSAASLLKIGGAGLLALTQAACSAKEKGAAFSVLSETEARDFAAIAARILPTTETPGATESGVIYFIDKAFAGEMSNAFESARSGLSDFNEQLAQAHPKNDGFSSLSDDEQDAFLETQEETQLFGLVWVMTMFGMFAMSKYGGNRDNVGWTLIDFDGAHGGWQYPFGHYDAEVHGGSYDE